MRPGALGLVQRLVGALDQPGERLARMYWAHPIDIVMWPRSSPFTFERIRLLGHGLADLLGQLARALQVGLRQDHGELLAAVARGQIAALDRLGQHLRHQTQHLIADLMAVGVVELLEMIDVGEQQRQRLPRSRLLVRGGASSWSKYLRLAIPVRLSVFASCWALARSVRSPSIWREVCPICVSSAAPAPHLPGRIEDLADQGAQLGLGACLSSSSLKFPASA